MLSDKEGSESPTSTDRGFDTGVFSQGDVWVDEVGRTFYVDDLSLDQRLVVLGWLRRHARHFYLQTMRHEFAALLLGADAAVPGDPVRSVPEILFLSAEQWLEETPLARALARQAGPGDRFSRV